MSCSGPMLEVTILTEKKKLPASCAWEDVPVEEEEAPCRKFSFASSVLADLRSLLGGSGQASSWESTLGPGAFSSSFQLSSSQSTRTILNQNVSLLVSDVAFSVERQIRRMGRRQNR